MTPPNFFALLPTSPASLCRVRSRSWSLPALCATRILKKPPTFISRLRKSFRTRTSRNKLTAGWIRFRRSPEVPGGPTERARFFGTRWSGPSQLFPLWPPGPCMRKTLEGAFILSRPILTAATMRGTATESFTRALSIVEHFKQRYLDFPGLNLTFEVREGIIKHSRDYSEAEFPQLREYLLDLRPPLEAQLIDWVDEIAYNTADIDDALEAGLLDLAVLCNEVPLFGAAYAPVEAAHPDAREKLKFNEALKRVLDSLATDLIESTQKRVLAFRVSSTEDVRRAPKRLAGFSEEAAASNKGLKRFLFAHIYNHPAITEDRDRSTKYLEELFSYYLER